METETIIAIIAKAREKRAALKTGFANNGLSCLSISLNIPGYPKSSELSKSFFKRIIQEVKDFLLANRILIDEKLEQLMEDDAGNYYVVPFVENSIDLFGAKELCEKFEMQHPIGRIVDIDISDQSNQPVSSGKTKLCVLCKTKPAIVCMREKNHSIEEVRRYIDSEINEYLHQVRKKEICRKLVSFALKSILYEVSLTPKPGLVNKLDSGIHEDMDYYTFLDSSSVLSSYFMDLASIGWGFNGELSNALPEIRQIGLEMERCMFDETGSVNTQKGIIFLLGVSLFASANSISRDKPFHELPAIIKRICEPLKNSEKSLAEELGRRLY